MLSGRGLHTSFYLLFSDIFFKVKCFIRTILYIYIYIYIYIIIYIYNFLMTIIITHIKIYNSIMVQ